MVRWERTMLRAREGYLLEDTVGVWYCESEIFLRWTRVVYIGFLFFRRCLQLDYSAQLDQEVDSWGDTRAGGACLARASGWDSTNPR